MQYVTYSMFYMYVTCSIIYMYVAYSMYIEVKVESNRYANEDIGLDTLVVCDIPYVFCQKCYLSENSCLTLREKYIEFRPEGAVR